MVGERGWLSLGKLLDLSLLLGACGRLGWLREHFSEAVVWASDDVGAEHGAGLAGGGGSGVDGGFNGCDVSFDNDVTHGTSYLAHGAGEGDVG